MGDALRAAARACKAAQDAGVVTGAAGIRVQQGAQHYSWDGVKPGATIAQVAIWHEYGTRTMPPRPFMGRAVAEFARDFRAGAIVDPPRKSDSLRDYARAIAQWTEEEAARLAHKLARKIHRELQTAQQWAAPLSARTIAAKGHPVPLHDTQSLATSIGWEVRVGGEVKGGIISV